MSETSEQLRSRLALSHVHAAKLQKLKADPLYIAAQARNVQEYPTEESRAIEQRFSEYAQLIDWIYEETKLD